MTQIIFIKLGLKFTIIFFRKVGCAGEKDRLRISDRLKEVWP